MIVERRLLETLPFPLASVLWDYESGSGRRSLDPLFNFLEVAAKFTTVVVLSGLRRDQSAFAEARGSWQGRVPPSELMKTPTFGSWSRLHAGASKAVRALIHSDRQRIENAFLVDSTERVELLVSRGLIGHFEDGVKYRNEWRGHGSIASPAELARRRERLQVAASAIAIELGRAFDGWTLFAAHAGSKRGGRFECSGDVLVGSNARFAERMFTLPHPVEIDQLHLLCDGMEDALTLVPLLRLSHPADTSDPAVYFYDRLDRNGVRWLSYHYEPQPELSEAVRDDLPAFLAQLDARPEEVRSPTPSEIPTEGPAPWPIPSVSAGSLSSTELLGAGASAAGLSVSRADTGDVFALGSTDLAWMHRLGDEHRVSVALPIEAAPHLPGAVLTEVPVGPGFTPATRISILTEEDALNAFRLLATAVAVSSRWELPSKALDDLLSRASSVLGGAGAPIAGWGMGWKQTTVGAATADFFWTAVVEVLAGAGYRRFGIQARDHVRLIGPSGARLELRIDAFGPIIGVAIHRPNHLADALLAHRRAVERLLRRRVAWLDFVSGVEIRERFPKSAGSLDDPEYSAEFARHGRDLVSAATGSVGASASAAGKQ